MLLLILLYSSLATNLASQGFKDDIKKMPHDGDRASPRTDTTKLRKCSLASRNQLKHTCTQGVQGAMSVALFHFVRL